MVPMTVAPLNVPLPPLSLVPSGVSVVSSSTHVTLVKILVSKSITMSAGTVAGGASNVVTNMAKAVPFDSAHDVDSPTTGGPLGAIHEKTSFVRTPTVTVPSPVPSTVRDIDTSISGGNIVKSSGTNAISTCPPPSTSVSVSVGVVASPLGSTGPAGSPAFYTT